MVRIFRSVPHTGAGSEPEPRPLRLLLWHLEAHLTPDPLDALGVATPPLRRAKRQRSAGTRTSHTPEPVPRFGRAKRPHHRAGSGRSAELLDTAHSPDRPGAPTRLRRPSPARPLPAVGPGSAVSRRHLLHDAIVEGEICDQPFQPRILLFQTLQPFGLLHTQAAIFFLRPIVRLLSDIELSTGVRESEALGRFNLNDPSMAEDFVHRVSVPCHIPLPFVSQRASLRRWPGLKREGQGHQHWTIT